MIYFFNCSWVDNRWQWYRTHLHTNNTQKDTVNNLTGKSAGRAPSLPYNWGKSMEKPQSGQPKSASWDKENRI